MPSQPNNTKAKPKKSAAISGIQKLAMGCPFVNFVTIWAGQNNYGAIPKMHREFCAFLEDTMPFPHRLLMAYRHSSKSTIICLYVAWRLARDPNCTFLIVSAVAELATRNSEFIRSVLESHPLCSHLVPERGNERWQTQKFNVVRSSTRTDYSVSVTSVGGRMTGKHADEIIGDDIEIAENSSTQEGREKINQTVDKLFSIGTKFLFTGTPHDTQTIYARLEDGVLPFVTRKWPVRKMDGTPQAPDFIQNGEPHDDAWIRTKELGTTGTFKSQFLLIPAHAYETLFDVELIRPFNDRITIDELDRDETPWHDPTPSFWIDGKRIKDIRAYLDVASGLKNRDSSVVAVAAKTFENDVYVLAIKTLPPVDLAADKPWANAMDVALDVCRDFHVNTLNVEQNGLGLTLAAEMKTHARSKGRKVRIRETLRGATNKKTYIAEAIEPLIKIGRFYLDSMILDDLRHPFMAELKGFPNARHDDHIDALAGAITELLPSRPTGKDSKTWLSEMPFRRDAVPVLVNDFH